MLYRKIIEFLKDNEDKIIVLNVYNRCIEIKLNLCNENDEILIDIKFKVKDGIGVSNARFNIMTEKWLLKSFADELIKLNDYNIGDELYLNKFIL